MSCLYADDSGFDRVLACSIAPALRMLYSKDGMATVRFFLDEDSLISAGMISGFVEPIFIEPGADIEAEFAVFTAAMGYIPESVVVRGLGGFSINAIGQLSETGSSHFNASGGRLAGKIAVVTGGAQGFGKGIASYLASEGAFVAVADLNFDGAVACAGELSALYGDGMVVALKVDVSSEDSVERMIQDTVLMFGGLDVLVSNAGVLVAGGLSDLSKDSFDLVTNVNYTGYFLCTKHAALPMKIQRRYSPDYMTDIIEINSKSGLEGSNKNFAYAGSKFGGIGLTQSFALELIEYGIKVNAICPGNLLDGPLWSDPERGLFKQYLDSGKVEGARSIEDVRKFYEAKVPMGRGCTVEDVTRAILYVIEQKYETGQAVPVTGGQVMLK